MICGILAVELYAIAYGFYIKKWHKKIPNYRIKIVLILVLYIGKIDKHKISKNRYLRIFWKFARITT